MAKWQAQVEAPLTYDYGRYTVCKPPWSQGPVTLQQLALLKGFNLDGMDVVGPDFIHLRGGMLEARLCRPREVLRRSEVRRRAVRDAACRDAYNAERRKLVTDKASMELRPGSVEGFGAIVKLKPGAKLVAGMGAGEPTVGRMGEVVGDTVHFDIVDKAGNMVTATPSGGWLQSSPVIPELGFCLGTRAQMFWLEEGHPASLAPGKRPRTTLSPTMALRDGDAYLAWGSPGGDQQDQWITQFFLRHVHAGMNLQEAIDAPAWHSEHFPISFWPRTRGRACCRSRSACRRKRRDELSKRGHILEVEPEWSEGRLTAASKDGLRRQGRGQSARHAGLRSGPLSAWVESSATRAAVPRRGERGTQTRVAPSALASDLISSASSPAMTSRTLALYFGRPGRPAVSLFPFPPKEVNGAPGGATGGSPPVPNPKPGFGARHGRSPVTRGCRFRARGPSNVGPGASRRSNAMPLSGTASCSLFKRRDRRRNLKEQNRNTHKFL